MAAFKKGDTVKVNVTVPEGPVVAMRMDEDGTVSYMVEWVSAEGVSQQRWFDESQLSAG
jgi:hypothetical protein